MSSMSDVSNVSGKSNVYDRIITIESSKLQFLITLCSVSYKQNVSDVSGMSIYVWYVHVLLSWCLVGHLTWKGQCHKTHWNIAKNQKMVPQHINFMDPEP